MQAIQIDKLPPLRDPILIAGFGGWGNALDVATGTVEYLIRHFDATAFARLDTDSLYRYDGSRPVINIQAGSLKRLSWPGGDFYGAFTGNPTGDLLILRADEPTLRWRLFAEEFFELCGSVGVRTIVTVGSMYDQVLHSDRLISGMASNDGFSAELQAADVIPIYYQGPTAIHGLIQAEGPKRGYDCISLWCHCPFYLENTTHFGLMAELGGLLARLGGFELDTKDLEEKWNALRLRIQQLIEENPNVGEVIEELKGSKGVESMAVKKEAVKDDKIIRLRDFLE